MIYFIRHSEPDYSHLKEDDSFSFAPLSPLTKEGKELAFSLREKVNLENTIILSSPYTRAFETASILANGKDIIIEPLLHEWLPSKKMNITIKDFRERDRIFKNKYRKDSSIELDDIESKEEMIERMNFVLKKYKDCKKDLVIVAHSRLIGVFFESIGKNIPPMKYCEIVSLKKI